MIKALLFDLDDTLLDSNMDQLMQQYFERIMGHSDGLIDREQFLQELLLGTRAMMTSTDTAVSNRDTFWQFFHRRTGLDIPSTEAHFNQFYETEFPQLQSFTRVRPTAREMIRWAFDRDYRVVIATNPVFPRRAVEYRLAWAGVPVDEFDYTLVTTYENAHATKPHAAYYRQILSVVGCQPQEALMIGDDWEQDIVPADRLGLFTYWINSVDQRLPDPDCVDGYGTLDALYTRLQAGWLEQLGAGV